MKEKRPVKKAKSPVTLISRISDLGGLKARICELSGLRDNWDGYGAVGPSDTVVGNSLKFIECAFGEGFYAIRKDDIIPTPYGSIVFDFTSEKGLVSVEIGSEKIGFFTEFTDKGDFSLDGVDTDFCSIPNNLRKAFEKL